jgi:hypothetical protein
VIQLLGAFQPQRKIRFRSSTNVEDAESFSGLMATQLGAESVTNPDGTSIPEIIDYFRIGNSVGVDLRQYSSRVPLGAFVMDWEADYRTFGSLFLRVAEGYRELMTGKSRFTLDFEYKKDVNLGLVVKQVRELPTPESLELITPYLLDEPADWVVAQREAGDVFGNHRLKSTWALRTANLKMTPANLAKGIYTGGTVQYHGDGRVQSLASPPSSWPGATNDPSGTTLSWTTDTAAAMRHWTLTTVLVTNLPPATPLPSWPSWIPASPDSPPNPSSSPAMTPRPTAPATIISPKTTSSNPAWNPTSPPPPCWNSTRPMSNSSISSSVSPTRGSMSSVGTDNSVASDFLKVGTRGPRVRPPLPVSSGRPSGASLP